MASGAGTGRGPWRPAASTASRAAGSSARRGRSRRRAARAARRGRAPGAGAEVARSSSASTRPSSRAPRPRRPPRASGRGRPRRRPGAAGAACRPRPGMQAELDLGQAEPRLRVRDHARVAGERQFEPAAQGRAAGSPPRPASGSPRSGVQHLRQQRRARRLAELARYRRRPRRPGPRRRSRWRGPPRPAPPGRGPRQAGAQCGAERVHGRMREGEDGHAAADLLPDHRSPVCSAMQNYKLHFPEASNGAPECMSRRLTGHKFQTGHGQLQRARDVSSTMQNKRPQV